MASSKLTTRQQVALSFAAAVSVNAPWRDLIVHRISFTGPGWDPLTQMFSSVAAGLTALGLGPGSDAALGFAALDEADAAAKEAEWKRILEPASPWQPLTAGPAARKEVPQ